MPSASPIQVALVVLLLLSIDVARSRSIFSYGLKRADKIDNDAVLASVVDRQQGKHHRRLNKERNSSGAPFVLVFSPEAQPGSETETKGSITIVFDPNRMNDLPTVNLSGKSRSVDKSTYNTVGAPFVLKAKTA